MTPEEIKLAHELIESAQNATGYGWDALVKGTALGGLFDLVFTCIWVIVTTYVGIYFYKKLEIEDASSDTKISFAIIVCAMAIVTAIVLGVIDSQVFATIAPEYTVINNLIDNLGGT